MRNGAGKRGKIAKAEGVGKMEGEAVSEVRP